MSPPKKGRRDAGPTQRQLRAGELVRHALAQVLREEQINDGALEGVSVTVTEVRLSPDMRHAICFVEPLGGVHVRAVVEGLNRAAKFLRGKLARQIELKFTPDLRFVHDESFEEADRMERLIAEARRADGVRHVEEPEEPETAPSVRVFPSPSKGEGQGGGVRAAAEAEGARGGAASPAPSGDRSAHTPTQPSPFEGEGAHATDSEPPR